jgi:IS5 family transposase
MEQRLTAAKVGDALFETVNRQFAKHGYIVRGGQIVDASLVPVPRQHVTEEERELIKAQAMPADWNPAQRRQKDTEATWTKRHGKSYFGYKVSVSADQRYKLIRKLKVSTTSANDPLHLEECWAARTPAATSTATRATSKAAAYNLCRLKACGVAVF